MAEGGGGRKEHNEVHNAVIWKQRVDGELKSQAEWEENWGFLRGNEAAPAPTRTGDAASATGGRVPSDGGRSQSNKSEDERYQALLNRTKPPKEKYSRPVTTTHEVGWRPSLELFGVNHHGKVRDPDLWPDRP
mmetsp:Transcript_27351/g.65957  ORF Transcript_27351/g.65957 Transcript_27351/m.65957 type:complete len:133 (+) Transcript_27351:68-466(+)